MVGIFNTELNMIKFKDWLKLTETGTGTNAVAVFARPIGIGTVSRNPLQSIGFKEVPKKMSEKKKKALEEAGWKIGSVEEFLG